MKILGIDTSCDDTCVAVLEMNRQKLKVLSNVVSSQIKIHKRYGGVYPSLAKREHQRNLTPVLKKSLEESRLLKPRVKKFKNKDKIHNLEKILQREKDLLKYFKKFCEKYQKPKIDFISVTVGPGLEPCLWVGVNFAKALSYFWDIPVIPINHIEAHIFANWLPPADSTLKDSYQIPKIKFPAIALVVSGGHTQLILVKKIGKYKIIGETRDDAAGECLDKVARILGLSYPGGPIIEKLSQETKTNIFHIKLPRPLFYSKDYDFSFSGLKTAVLYETRKSLPKVKKKKEIYVQEMAKETQQSIIDVLVRKTIRAARDFQVNSILLGGGVASNQELRKTFLERISSDNFHFFVPSPKNCTDNAAMIALSGLFHCRKEKSTKDWKMIKALPNLRF